MIPYRAIGLIGAMDEEVRLFRSAVEDDRRTTAAGIDFHEGAIGGKRVVVCKSGVGKVNAAVCAQLLIDRFGIEACIFTGVAGALDPELGIGDIVVSRDCMQHDVDATALGYARGTIPYQEVSVFPADRSLVEAALLAGRRLHDGLTVEGRVLSGDQFIADRKAVRRLREELNGTCVEMEGAAVAQVCHMNGIPYVVIRTMSDQADGAAPNDFGKFVRTAAERSSRIVAAMLGLP
jgi:adenosylhomocysteine nucleosidase